MKATSHRPPDASGLCLFYHPIDGTSAIQRRVFPFSTRDFTSPLGEVFCDVIYCRYVICTYNKRKYSNTNVPANIVMQMYLNIIPYSATYPSDNDTHIVVFTCQ